MPRSIDRLIADTPRWLESGLLVVLAIGAVIVAHAVAMRILGRLAARTRTRTDDILLARLGRSSRYLLVAMALSAIQPALALDRWALIAWQRIAGLAVPALLGWACIALLGAINDIVQARADIGVADNLRARRRRTRAGILYRIGLFVVMLVTLCLMLMSIPGVRTVGVTLIASAGLAALAVGAAAQPALKNLIGGLQMVFTEPIRIDDVVIIDGEWGRIEDIRLTFVVVKIWDERRLVVPVSKFLEESFQNWTRQTSQLLGTAFLQVDPTADVQRLREKLDEVVKGNRNWDGRVAGLQVTELHSTHMELRCLVSASDASKAFDLRCDVREAMMAFIVREMPEALVRYRGEWPAAAGAARA